MKSRQARSRITGVYTEMEFDANQEYILRAIANRNNDLQSAVFDGGAALCAAKRFVYTPSAKATMWLWRLLRSLQSTTCCALQ